MPNGDAEVVIFVLNLLLEFDSGNHDLLGFTKKYFPAEDEQKSYKLFYDGVIEVFADRICRIMIEGLTPSGDTSDRDRDIDYVNDGIRQQLAYLLEKLVEGLDATNRISKKVRADYFRMMEGFQIALNTRDIELIKGIDGFIPTQYASKDFIKITYNGNISDFLNEYEKQSVKFLTLVAWLYDINNLQLIKQIPFSM